MIFLDSVDFPFAFVWHDFVNYGFSLTSVYLKSSKLVFNYLIVLFETGYMDQ